MKDQGRAQGQTTLRGLTEKDEREKETEKKWLVVQVQESYEKRILNMF